MSKNKVKRQHKNTKNEVRFFKTLSNSIISFLIGALISYGVTYCLNAGSEKYNIYKDLKKIQTQDKIMELTWYVRDEIEGINVDLNNWLKNCLETNKVEPITMSQVSIIDLQNILKVKELRVSDIKFDWIAFKYNISSRGFWNYRVYDYLMNVESNKDLTDYSVRIDPNERLSSNISGDIFRFDELYFGNIEDYKNLVVCCIMYFDLEGSTQAFLISEYLFQLEEFDYNQISNYKENIISIIEAIWEDKHVMSTGENSINTKIYTNNHEVDIKALKNFRFIINSSILRSYE